MTLRTIDGYALDCVLSEEVTLDAEVTEYPVESGAAFADHIQNSPVEVSLTVVVSDTPIGEVAKVRRAGVVYSSEARDFLRNLRSERRPFTYVGTTGVYAQMVLAHLGEPRDNATGDALIVEVTLRQIRVADVRREVVRQEVSLGHRPARSVDGPPMWLCPDLLVVSNDPAANAAKKCRRVVQRGGVLRFFDTGEALTLGQINDLGAQRVIGVGGGQLDARGNGDFGDKLAWNEDRGWVNRSTYAKGGKIGTVDGPLTSAQRAKVAEFEAQDAQRLRSSGYDVSSLDEAPSISDGIVGSVPRF